MTIYNRSSPCESDGYVLIVTLFFLLILTAIGMAAIMTTTIEVEISGNNRRMVNDFYAAEGAMITVLEKCDQWLEEDFLSDPKTAYWSRKVDVDGDGVEDALVEVRCVEPDNQQIPSLSAAANRVPADRHISPPPVNSGYSLRYFTARKYAVTATALRSGGKLQCGAWKAFGREEEIQ